MVKSNVFRFSIKDIAEISILTALAIILDTFVKIPFALTGGSLNICAVPLIIISLRHGSFKGFIASGLLFGLITCLIDGYGLITYPLEYLVAFGSIGLFGFIAKYVNNHLSDKKLNIILLLVLFTFLWATIRFFAASIDSHIIYEYDWIASFGYNLTYVYPSAALDLIIVIALVLTTFPAIKKFKTSYLSE